MTNAARTLLSTLLLTAAVAVALVGSGAQWLDRLAHTSGPLTDIMAPLAGDGQVRDAVAATLTEGVAADLPDVVSALPGAQARIEQLIASAVDDAMDDPALAEAWAESVDLSRIDLVTDLAAFRSSGGDAPTLWLHVGPFVDLGRTRLLESTPAALSGIVAGLEWQTDPRIALGRPDPQQAAWAADALDVVSGWVWFYVAAIALALLGLAVGPRRGRWVALTVAAALGVVALSLARRVAVDVAAPQGTGLVTAVQGQLTAGAVDSLLRWSDPVQVVGWVLVTVGLVGIALAPGRRPPSVNS